ncbi:MAG: rod shape-determining protein MreC [Clostridiales Family XIII bacterium]|jgi:rod shape-determining protein MreC|nr:rod shape-determining protein MreC [Clostridiales Family XIII bacterium]
MELLVLFFASYATKDSESCPGRVAGTVIAYIQKPFAALRDAVSGGLDGLIGDGNAAAETEALREELERVKRELAKEKLSREELSELEKLSEVLSSPQLKQDYTLAAANVISMENSDTFDIFTIDVGVEAGVRRNSPVVCGDGLVGRVLTADRGWSKVVAIIDENNKIGFQLHREKDFLGVCYGDGKGDLTGYLLDESASADEGDEVLTSGVGGIYPAGLVVGKVMKAEQKGNSDLLELSISSAVYFKGLKKVAVLI